MTANGNICCFSHSEKSSKTTRCTGKYSTHAECLGEELSLLVLTKCLSVPRGQGTAESRKEALGWRLEVVLAPVHCWMQAPQMGSSLGAQLGDQIFPLFWCGMEQFRALAFNLHLKAFASKAYLGLQWSRHFSQSIGLILC